MYDKGGWDAVNALFQNPPATQEQAMEFEKFQSHEIASRPAPAGLEDKLTGWTEGVDSGQFGAFDVGAYIRALSGEGSFNGALYGYFGGIGWGSGWVRQYANNDRAIAQMSLSFESTDDLENFLDVFAPIAVRFGANLNLPPVEDIFKPTSTHPIKSGDVVSWSRGPTAGPVGVIAVDSSSPSLDILIASDAASLALVAPASR